MVVPLHPLATVKGGHLRLWSAGALGDGPSFHAPLHRFFATSIVEASRASALTPVLEVKGRLRTRRFPVGACLPVGVLPP